MAHTAHGCQPSPPEQLNNVGEEGRHPEESSGVAELVQDQELSSEGRRRQEQGEGINQCTVIRRVFVDLEVEETHEEEVTKIEHIPKKHQVEKSGDEDVMQMNKV